MKIDEKTTINLFAGVGSLAVVVVASFFIAGIAQKVDSSNATNLIQDSNILEIKTELKILTELRERLVRIETKIDKDK